jgi:hypothetical protein
MYIHWTYKSSWVLDLFICLIYISGMATRERKEKVVIIRLSEAEKQGFREASDVAGVGLSTWIRERLRHAAIRELEQAGRIAPFIKRAG